MNAPQPDTQHDRDYQRFVDEMAKHCHCSGGNKPCDGVLAGGICDGIGDLARDSNDDELDDFDVAFEELTKL